MSLPGRRPARGDDRVELRRWWICMRSLAPLGYLLVLGGVSLQDAYRSFRKTIPWEASVCL